VDNRDGEAAIQRSTLNEFCRSNYVYDRSSFPANADLRIYARNGNRAKWWEWGQHEQLLEQPVLSQPLHAVGFEILAFCMAVAVAAGLNFCQNGSRDVLETSLLKSTLLSNARAFHFPGG